VVTIPFAVGPKLVVQVVAPPVPEIVQVADPDGAAALAEPVTVAVKVIDPPRVGVPEGVTAIDGVAAETTVEFVDNEAATA
jgi:hypothetical protein